MRTVVPSKKNERRRSGAPSDCSTNCWKERSQHCSTTDSDNSWRALLYAPVSLDNLCPPSSAACSKRLQGWGQKLRGSPLTNSSTAISRVPCACKRWQIISHNTRSEEHTS